MTKEERAAKKQKIEESHDRIRKAHGETPAVVRAGVCPLCGGLEPPCSWEDSSSASRPWEKSE